METILLKLAPAAALKTAQFAKVIVWGTCHTDAPDVMWNHNAISAPALCNLVHLWPLFYSRTPASHLVRVPSMNVWPLANNGSTEMWPLMKSHPIAVSPDHRGVFGALTGPMRASFSPGLMNLNETSLRRSLCKSLWFACLKWFPL